MLNRNLEAAKNRQWQINGNQWYRGWSYRHGVRRNIAGVDIDGKPAASTPENSFAKPKKERRAASTTKQTEKTERR